MDFHWKLHDIRTPSTFLAPLPCYFLLSHQLFNVIQNSDLFTF